MAQVYRSLASLRIIGEELNPVEITELLGCDASDKYSKGDVRTGKKTGKKYIYKFGMWSLKASEHKPENLDAQISEILNKLSSDLKIWVKITSQYKVDLFCGVFMEEGNEGMSISPASLKALGDRGILLDLDIYDGYDDA